MIQFTLAVFAVNFVGGTVIVQIAGDNARAVIEAARDWLQKHWPTFVAVLARSRACS